MSTHNITVNDVRKNKNKFLCLASIDNYRNVLKRVSVGESIQTDPFQVDFCDSIGTSNWILIYFPNGQYVETSNSYVTESGRASMYLRMVDCEHQHDSLTMTIRFFIKSPYCDVLDKFSCSKYATFSYRNSNERWCGPFDLAAIEELYSSRCKNLFLNDSLTVGCELDDTTFHLRAPTPPMMGLNETSDSSYSDDQRNLTVGLEDTLLRPYRTPTYPDDKRSVSVGFQFGDTTFLYYTPPSQSSNGASRTGDQRSLTRRPQLDVTKSRPSTPPSMMQPIENVHGTGKSYTDDRCPENVRSRMNDTKFRPRTPRRTLQQQENSLPVEGGPDNKTFRPCTLQLEMQPNDNRNAAGRSVVDVKFENDQDRVQKSVKIDFKLNDTAPHQSVPQVHAKVNPRRTTSTLNTDDKATNEFKGRKNPKRMSVQEPFSAYRNVPFKHIIEEAEKEHDPIMKNEKKHSCACQNRNEMISKETQTWDDRLRSNSRKVNKSGTDDVCQSPSCRSVKSKVALFEKFSSSKN